MENVVDQFLYCLEIEKNYSKRTIEEYKKDLNIFKNFLKKNILATDKVDIRKFMAYIKLERDYSPSAILRKLATLRSFFKFCLREDYISKNPLDYITPPKNNVKLPIFLIDEEVKKLINVAYSQIFSLKGKRNYAIIMLLLAGGLRVSELINLTIGNIEFNDNSLNIKVKGKGNKERVIPIINKAKEALGMWLRERPSSKCENVFININLLQPISDDSVQRLVKKTAEKAGIKKKITPHKLRHTFATNLMKNNVNIASIQDLLGHVNLNTTRIYTHISMQDVQKAVAMLSYN